MSNYLELTIKHDALTPNVIRYHERYGAAIAMNYVWNFLEPKLCDLQGADLAEAIEEAAGGMERNEEGGDYFYTSDGRATIDYNRRIVSFDLVTFTGDECLEMDEEEGGFNKQPETLLKEWIPYLRVLAYNEDVMELGSWQDAKTLSEEDVKSINSDPSDWLSENGASEFLTFEIPFEQFRASLPRE
jgi:hypothetical protein